MGADHNPNPNPNTFNPTDYYYPPPHHHPHPHLPPSPSPSPSPQHGPSLSIIGLQNALTRWLWPLAELTDGGPSYNRATTSANMFKMHHECTAALPVHATSARTLSPEVRAEAAVDHSKKTSPREREELVCAMGASQLIKEKPPSQAAYASLPTTHPHASLPTSHPHASLPSSRPHASLPTSHPHASLPTSHPRASLPTSHPHASLSMPRLLSVSRRRGASHPG